MKRENRILGMIACLAFLLMGFAIFAGTVHRELGLLITMFSAGYGFRETLDRSETE